MLPGPGSSPASPKRINPVHIQEVPVRVEAKSVPVQVLQTSLGTRRSAGQSNHCQARVPISIVVSTPDFDSALTLVQTLNSQSRAGEAPLPAGRNALGGRPFQVLGHCSQEPPVRVSSALSLANSVLLVTVAI